MATIPRGPAAMASQEEVATLLSGVHRSAESALRMIGAAMEKAEKADDEKLLDKLSRAYVATHAARVAAQFAYDRQERKNNDSDSNSPKPTDRHART